MSIKITKGNSTREIKLLPSIKNPDTQYFKFGNKYAELTTDLSKTNTGNKLKFTKISDGSISYIREKFIINVKDYIIYEASNFNPFDYPEAEGISGYTKILIPSIQNKKFNGTFKFWARINSINNYRRRIDAQIICFATPASLSITLSENGYYTTPKDTKTSNASNFIPNPTLTYINVGRTANIANKYAIDIKLSFTGTIE